MDIRPNAISETVTAELKVNETIAQLARRHFKDKSHTTSDEELRNAKIELSDIVSVNAKDLFTFKNFTTQNSM